jgi:hypothetical protein
LCATCICLTGQSLDESDVECSEEEQFSDDMFASVMKDPIPSVNVVPVTEETANNSCAAKQPKQCPLCGKKVFDLPRHMRSKKHKWDPFKAHSVVQMFGLRKAYKYSCETSASKNQQRRLIQSVEVRSAVVKQTDYHKPRK